MSHTLLDVPIERCIGEFMEFFYFSCLYCSVSFTFWRGLV